jgi:hypothetical protein
MPSYLRTGQQHFRVMVLWCFQGQGGYKGGELSWKSIEIGIPPPPPLPRVRSGAPSTAVLLPLGFLGPLNYMTVISMMAILKIPTTLRRSNGAAVE